MLEQDKEHRSRETNISKRSIIPSYRIAEYSASVNWKEYNFTIPSVQKLHFMALIIPCYGMAKQGYWFVHRLISLRF